MNAQKIALLLAAAFAVAGCGKKDGPAENFGEQVDDAISDARDRVDEAGDEAREAADEIRDAFSDN